MTCEPDYAPGRFVLLRADSPAQQWFVWCGRSLGWLPFDTTSNVFFRFFASTSEANEAADKWIDLPLQE